MHQRDNQVNTTLSLEEQNHLLLQETLKIVRRMHRIYLTQVTITILFVVLPILGSILFLPRIVSSLTSTIQSMTAQFSTQSSSLTQEQIQQQLQNEINKQINTNR